MGEIIKLELYRNNKVNYLVHKYPETLIFCDKKYLNKTDYALKETKKKSSNTFLDFSLIQNNQKYFIGRFNSYQYVDFILDFDINNRFVIVYTKEFDNKLGKTVINNILSLYDIQDKTEIVGTFNELSNLYNKFAKTKLTFKNNNNDKLIYRTDVERIKKSR